MRLSDAITIAKGILNKIYTDNITLRKEIKTLRKALDHITHYAALYHHFTALKQYPEISGDRIDSQLLRPIQESVEEEAKRMDAFQNPVLNAEFETRLSYAILKQGDTQALVKINQAIVAYLKRHHDSLDESHGAIIRAELAKYKLPFNPSLSPIDVLIEKLERRLPQKHTKERIQILSETFSLHLLFFNYHHVYDPTRDLSYPSRPEATKVTDKDLPSKVTLTPRDQARPHPPPDPKKRLMLESRRKSIHNKVRPKHDEQDMFLDNIRGRIKVYSKHRSADFGICDKTHTPDKLKNLYAHVFTPHKYRSKPNPNSPLVKHFKSNGIAFISGPSGTAADCIEGLSLLCPSLSTEGYQSYLNLMAAAETGLGHHSMHEVILTAAHAGVLPMITIKDKTKPFWERLDYKQTYRQFLTKTFKQSKDFHSLTLCFPQYLDGSSSNNTDLTQDKVALAAYRWKRYTDAQAASRYFRRSEFWENHPSKYSKVDPDTLFIQELSDSNFSKIKNEVGDLTTKEKRFFRIFMAQQVVFTHATNYIKEIEKNGRILSDVGLTKVLGKHRRNADDEDIHTLQNNDYIFFRFELAPLYYKASRFGDTKMLIQGRHNELMQYCWISLFEMLNPSSASILQSLTHNGKEVRFYGEYTDGAVTAFYPGKHKNEKLGKYHRIDLGYTIFSGSALMPGLAYCMIRELRRIGGTMQIDFLNLFSQAHFDIQDKKYQSLIERMNQVLSQLFRVEAKIPRQLYLKHYQYKTITPATIKTAIEEDNVFELRQALKPEDYECPLWSFDVLLPPLSPIEYAIICGKIHVIEWLWQEGARPREPFAAYPFDILFETTKNILSLSPQLINYLFNELKLFNIDNRTSYNGSWLHFAASTGQFEALNTLIDLGVRLQIKDINGYHFLEIISLDSLLQAPEHIHTVISLYKKLNKPFRGFVHSLSEHLLLEIVFIEPARRKVIIKEWATVVTNKQKLTNLANVLLEQTTDYESLALLLENGAAINDRDIEQYAALILRLSKVNPAAVQHAVETLKEKVRHPDSLIPALRKRLRLSLTSYGRRQMEKLLAAYPKLFDDKKTLDQVLNFYLYFNVITPNYHALIIQLLENGAELKDPDIMEIGTILFETALVDHEAFIFLFERYISLGVSSKILLNDVRKELSKQWPLLSKEKQKSLKKHIPELFKHQEVKKLVSKSNKGFTQYFSGLSKGFLWRKKDIRKRSSGDASEDDPKSLRKFAPDLSL